MILKAHVDEVIVEGGRAAGVRYNSTSGGSSIRAREAVVSSVLSLSPKILLQQQEAT